MPSLQLSSVESYRKPICLLTSAPFALVELLKAALSSAFAAAESFTLEEAMV